MAQRLRYQLAGPAGKEDSGKQKPQKKEIAMKKIFSLQRRAIMNHFTCRTTNIGNSKLGSRGRWWAGMMDSVSLVSALVCALLFAATTTAFGQATESEMRAFPMPPVNGYAHEKAFAYVGDYGYYSVPSSSSLGGGVRPSDYQYVKYSNLSGKQVYIRGRWGTTPIPKPTFDPVRREWADACGHAHTSYGVWGRYEIKFLGATFRGWSFLGGGSMSGVRKGIPGNWGPCVHKVDNPLKEIDMGRFGWGQEFLTFDFTGGTIFTELVLAVQSNTHGWGSCRTPTGVFQACLEPSWAIATTD
jgi:hypothetical protein